MALRTPTSQPLRIHTACVPPVLYVHRSLEFEKDARSVKREQDRWEKDKERESALVRKRKKKRELGVEWQRGMVRGRGRRESVASVSNLG